MSLQFPHFHCTTITGRNWVLKIPSEQKMFYYSWSNTRCIIHIYQKNTTFKFAKNPLKFLNGCKEYTDTDINFLLGLLLLFAFSIYKIRFLVFFYICSFVTIHALKSFKNFFCLRQARPLVRYGAVSKCKTKKAKHKIKSKTKPTDQTNLKDPKNPAKKNSPPKSRSFVYLKQNAVYT